MAVSYLFSSVILPLFLALPLPFKAAFVTFTGFNYVVAVKRVEARQVELMEEVEAAEQAADAADE